MKKTVIAALALVCAGLPAFAGAPEIEGRYLESRSCDVYVAACFANGEVGVTGDEATMAWHITRGALDGVDLAGLTVVAVIQADDTLGNVARQSYDTKAVLFVDDNATQPQQAALVQFAKEMAGDLIDDVVEVKAAPINFAMKTCDNEGCARLTVGEVLEVATRCLHEHDKHCGNEAAWYPPLTNVDNAEMVFAERDRFSGEGLGVNWDTNVRASAYLATFAR